MQSQRVYQVAAHELLHMLTETEDMVMSLVSETMDSGFRTAPPNLYLDDGPLDLPDTWEDTSCECPVPDTPPSSVFGELDKDMFESAANGIQKMDTADQS